MINRLATDQAIIFKSRMQSIRHSISRVLIVIALSVAMATTGFAHHFVDTDYDPDLAAYIQTSGSLASLCGTADPGENTITQSCDACRLSYASMNHDRKEVPWPLEQTPMPASGSTAGTVAIAPGVAINIDTVDALAGQIGFDARYQLNLPAGDTGVWTLSRDSMSTDSTDPMSDRTVHVDQFTGNILADVRYDDYSLFGKAMAFGIALHMGTLGLWSVLANTLVCPSVLFLCVSSVVMWWKRRPAGANRLSAPPMPKDMPLWQGAMLVGLAVSLAFPMAGITLVTVLALDLLLLSRLPVLRRALN